METTTNRVNPFTTPFVETENDNNEVSTPIQLTEEEKTNILKYCTDTLNKVKSYVENKTSVDEVYDLLNTEFGNCSNWTDNFSVCEMPSIEEILFMFGRIMISGLVTPCGTILSKSVLYNPFDENGTLYDVNTLTNEINEI